MNLDSDQQALLDDVIRLQAKLQSRLDQEQSNLTSLAKRLWAQQESEKARLSRELHDGVGQLLTGLTRRLQGLSDKDPDLGELAKIAEMALADVRQLSRLMSPTILDDLGLGPALKWLSRSLFEGTDIEHRCELSPSHTIPKDIAILVFRIAQESLTNALKHSGADQVQIALQHHQRVVRLDIVDNGMGFDQHSVVAGIGMSSMRDRAQAFGAELDYESKLGAGTRISLTVAYEDTSHSR